MRTCLQTPLSMSQMRSVVSLDPEMAVFSSDIFKQRTVDVWPRRVWTAALVMISESLRQATALLDIAMGIDGYSPSGHIPDPYVAVTTTTHKKIAPRYHCPDTHNVTLQSLLVLALSVKHMDLRIVKRNDDILVGKV